MGSGGGAATPNLRHRPAGRSHGKPGHRRQLSRGKLSAGEYGSNACLNHRVTRVR